MGGRDDLPPRRLLEKPVFQRGLHMESLGWTGAGTSRCSPTITAEWIETQRQACRPKRNNTGAEIDLKRTMRTAS